MELSNTNVIWKIPLKFEEINTIEMPADHKILTVQMQNDIPTIWAVVDPASPKVNRFIKLYATGAKVDELLSQLSYIGTIQHKGYVFHVFGPFVYLPTKNKGE